MRKLLDYMQRLDDEHIPYRLEHVRDTVMVAVAVPGERWEIEFFDDGQVEIERFRSSGAISLDESLLEALVHDHGSQPGTPNTG